MTEAANETETQIRLTRAKNISCSSARTLSTFRYLDSGLSSGCWICDGMSGRMLQLPPIQAERRFCDADGESCRTVFFVALDPWDLADNEISRAPFLIRARDLSY